MEGPMTATTVDVKDLEYDVKSIPLLAHKP